MKMAMDERLAMDDNGHGWRQWMETAIDGDGNGNGQADSNSNGWQ